MVITRSGIAALVVVCGAAGAGGAYLATRSSVDQPAAASSAGPVAAAEARDLTSTPSEDSVPDRTRQERAGLSTPRTVTRTMAASNDRALNAAPAAPEPAPPTATVERSASAPDVNATALTRAQLEPEPARTVEQASAASTEPDFEELVVESDVVLGLQMDTTVSSEDARIEDTVVAHVTRDVRVAGRIAIPSGAKAYGEVTVVERGGRLRERARLGVRFSSLLLSDGTRVPISTDIVFRDGDSPSRESAAKIGGGAIGGAIIGGILGGGKGAVLGGTAGAGAGTAVAMTGGRNAATLTAGTPVTVRLARPATVTVDR